MEVRVHLIFLFLSPEAEKVADPRKCIFSVFISAKEDFSLMIFKNSLRITFVLQCFPLSAPIPIPPFRKLLFSLPIIYVLL